MRVTAAGAARPQASRGVGSFRAVGATDVDGSVVARSPDADAPRVAAHLAVLHEAASHVRLEINFHRFAAIRARHDEFIHTEPTKETEATDSPLRGPVARGGSIRLSFSVAPFVETVPSVASVL